MTGDEKTFITHRYFNTALLSLIAGLIMAAVWVVTLIAEKADANRAKIEASMERYDARLRTHIDERLRNESGTRTAAIAVMNEKFSTALLAQSARMDEMRGTIGMLGSEVTALARSYVTADMIARVISAQGRMSGQSEIKARRRVAEPNDGERIP